LGLGGWIFVNPVRRSLAGARWGFALAVLITQIVLGGLTVLKGLAFWSVTLHLLTGNLFLLSLLSVRASLAPSPLTASSTTRILAFAVAAMWFVQMALGGLVSSNYAGLACTEWPTCNGGVWFPVLDGIIGLQLAHRAGAYVLFILAGAFYLKSVGRPMHGPAKRIFGTVVFQIVIGILNVLWAMPVEIAVLHSATADLIGVFAVLAVLRLSPGQGMHPAQVSDSVASV
jgi:cytochrome c oxidase assembly protein subunit 15